MTELGKPKAFLTDGIPGEPPILYFGNHKMPLDDGTALLWLQVFIRYFENKVRSLIGAKHG